VSASSTGSIALSNFDLGPAIGFSGVVAPDIVQLAIVVLLTTKHVDFAADNAHRNGSTGSGALWAHLTVTDLLSGDCCALLLESDYLVGA
jgi:hypothetical protein